MQLPDVRAWLDRLGDRWPWFGRLLAIQTRFSELHGGSTSAAVTLTAFLTMFPLLVLALSVVGFVAAASDDFAEQVVETFGVTGDAANLVIDAVNAAQSSRRVTTIVGLVGLLWTGLGLAGVIGAAYNTAWQVRSRGLLDRLYGLAWMVGAGAFVAANVGLGVLDARWPPPPSVLVAGTGMAVNTGFWLFTSWLLPNRRVPLRALLPAALVGGLAVEVLKQLGALVLPLLVDRTAGLYGAIGTVLALIGWLFLFGRLLVYLTVIEVTGWERHHGTIQAVIELPALPGGAERTDDVSRAGER